MRAWSFCPLFCLMLCALAISSVPAPVGGLPPTSQRAEAAGVLDALDAATHDLCGRDVVMLGENGYHGDGRTPAFKAALIRRLVSRCHFNAVFFEATHYDFLEFARMLRSGEPVSPNMVSSAIGWNFNQYQEIAPLVPFLFAEARSGRVALGGLDDQVGSLGAFYSNERMPIELAAFLDASQRIACQALLVQRIMHGYPGAAPHSEPDYARLRQCLANIRAAVASGVADGVRRDELLDIVANFERNIARDFDTTTQRTVERDYSMFLNLRWLAARLPFHPKIIIWAANAHVAKDTRVAPPFAGGRNLGSYVREAYGSRAFALGFTAASGSFRWGDTTRPIPLAPPGSLEARSLVRNDRDAAYLGPTQLQAMGEVVGAAADDHQYVSARWANIYDAILVFRAERPPTPRERAVTPRSGL